MPGKKLLEQDRRIPPLPLYADAIVRGLMALMFLESFCDKLFHWSAFVAEAGQKGIPFPSLAILAAILIEGFGSVTLLTGRLRLPGAALLAVYVLTLSFFYFDFWNLSGAASAMARKEFLKDLAVIAGLLCIALSSPNSKRAKAVTP